LERNNIQGEKESQVKKKSGKEWQVGLWCCPSTGGMIMVLSFIGSLQPSFTFVPACHQPFCQWLLRILCCSWALIRLQTPQASPAATMEALSSTFASEFFSQWIRGLPSMCHCFLLKMKWVLSYVWDWWDQAKASSVWKSNWDPIHVELQNMELPQIQSQAPDILWGNHVEDGSPYSQPISYPSCFRSIHWHHCHWPWWVSGAHQHLSPDPILSKDASYSPLRRWMTHLGTWVSLFFFLSFFALSLLIFN